MTFIDTAAASQPVVKEGAGEPLTLTCLVAYSPMEERCYILERSHDVKTHDLLMSECWFDCGGDDDWCKGRRTGLYRLSLTPWSRYDAFNGEWDGGVNATHVETIFEMPEVGDED